MHVVGTADFNDYLFAGGVNTSYMDKVDTSINGTADDGCSPESFHQFDGKVFFNAEESQGNEQLYSHDGVAASVTQITSFNNSRLAGPYGFADLGNALYIATDGDGDGSSNELMKYVPGQAVKTVRSFGSEINSTFKIHATNNRLIFSTVDGLLRSSDGTATGTQVIKNYGSILFEDPRINQGHLFFTYDSSPTKYAVTDGTANGTTTLDSSAQNTSQYNAEYQDKVVYNTDRALMIVGPNNSKKVTSPKFKGLDAVGTSGDYAYVDSEEQNIVAYHFPSDSVMTIETLTDNSNFTQLISIYEAADYVFCAGQ